MDIKSMINKYLGRPEETPVSIREDMGQIQAAVVTQAMQIKAQYDEYQQNKRDVEAIAMFIRENYGDEIKRGRHMGLALSQVVIMYLGKERDLCKPRDGGVQ